MTMTALPGVERFSCWSANSEAALRARRGFNEQIFGADEQVPERGQSD
jgi:hypothetical protein